MHRALPLFGLLLLAATSRAQLSYGFETDAQGWRRANFNTASLTLEDVGPAVWNSGGYIEGADFATYAFHVSPELGGLNLSGAYGGRFSLDYSSAAANNPLLPNPFLVVTNGTGAIYRTQNFAGTGTFGSYGYALDTTGGWLYGTTLTNSAPATEAQIRGVLASVTRIGVTADVSSGPEFTRVDNVRIAAVPEPASLVAVSLGLLALRRRRRS